MNYRVCFLCQILTMRDNDYALVAWFWDNWTAGANAILNPNDKTAMNSPSKNSYPIMLIFLQPNSHFMLSALCPKYENQEQNDKGVHSCVVISMKRYGHVQRIRPFFLYHRRKPNRECSIAYSAVFLLTDEIPWICAMISNWKIRCLRRLQDHGRA